ncbi:MAG: glycosyltransferase [Acidobacteriota bacterium]
MNSTPEAPPRLSVIIPVRNARGQLERCLKSLSRQRVKGEGYEVIVVDDGSSDGSAEVVSRWNARLIRQDGKGAGAARNRGVREASGEVILFLDADCEAAPQWIQKLVEPIGKDSISGTVGRFTSEQKHWVARLIQIEFEGRYDRMKGFDRVDFVNTATCGFKRQVLREHLFDEGFEKLEDIELSFRLARNGGRIIYVPEATVRHVHPESVWAFMRRKFRYGKVAPALYRRYPGKALSDTGTPHYRRLQLALIGLALLALPLAPPQGLFLWLASMPFSLPLVARAFRQSPGLGLISPFFFLAGNTAFVVGSGWGLLSSWRTRRSRTL